MVKIFDIFVSLKYAITLPSAVSIFLPTRFVLYKDLLYKA